MDYFALPLLLFLYIAMTKMCESVNVVASTLTFEEE